MEENVLYVMEEDNGISLLTHAHVQAETGMVTHVLHAQQDKLGTQQAYHALVHHLHSGMDLHAEHALELDIGTMQSMIVSAEQETGMEQPASSAHRELTGMEGHASAAMVIEFGTH
jgi:hypothetical protein